MLFDLKTRNSMTTAEEGGEEDEWVELGDMVHSLPDRMQ